MFIPSLSHSSQILVAGTILETAIMLIFPSFQFMLLDFAIAQLRDIKTNCVTRANGPSKSIYSDLSKYGPLVFLCVKLM